MVEFYKNPNQCSLNMNKSNLIYVLSLNVVLIFIPAVGLSVLYIIIIFKIRQTHKVAKTLKLRNQLNDVCLNDEKGSRRSKNLSTRVKKGSNKKSKITIIISITTILFYCCQLPVRIFLSWSYFRDYAYRTNLNLKQYSVFDVNSHTINHVSKAVTIIYFLQCISNPIIYNLLSSRFRKTFSSFSDYKKLSYRSTLRHLRN